MLCVAVQPLSAGWAVMVCACICPVALVTEGRVFFPPLTDFIYVVVSSFPKDGQKQKQPKCQFQVTPASQLKTWWIEHLFFPPRFCCCRSSLPVKHAPALSPSHLVRLSATITQGAAERERERENIFFFLSSFIYNRVKSCWDPFSEGETGDIRYRSWCSV